MKIVVLGGGAQGRVIASDLARALPQDSITVADIRKLIAEHDLAVGACS